MDGTGRVGASSRSAPGWHAAATLKARNRYAAAAAAAVAAALATCAAICRVAQLVHDHSTNGLCRVCSPFDAPEWFSCLVLSPQRDGAKQRSLHMKACGWGRVGWLAVRCVCRSVVARRAQARSQQGGAEKREVGARGAQNSPFAQRSSDAPNTQRTWECRIPLLIGERHAPTHRITRVPARGASVPPVSTRRVSRRRDY